jgi:hypothetical protein
VTARLIVQPEAESDLVEAFRWYESKHVGLGTSWKLYRTRSSVSQNGRCVTP